jgi:nitroimidazol reductase NimA-like FMN-containing flavoprotein (pyridoxamine 5'-phosphate oxidase superfamily)
MVAFGREVGQEEDMDRQQHLDLGAIARTIIDANFYMTLGTADENGRPWVSPVYYAHQGYATFYWVSSPEATHSRNLVGRPEVSIVMFDSRTPVGSGQGVYISAVAEELMGADLHRGIAIFSRRSESHGAGEWNVEDVSQPARHRLYRATASEHWVLGERDRRMPVSV